MFTVKVSEQRSGTPSLKDFTDDQWRDAGAAGFGILSAGKAGLEGFLKDLQKSYPYSRMAKERPQAVFGRVYQILEYGREDEAFDPVREPLPARGRPRGRARTVSARVRVAIRTRPHPATAPHRHQEGARSCRREAGAGSGRGRGDVLSKRERNRKIGSQA
jgi:hypothetical protein